MSAKERHSITRHDPRRPLRRKARRRRGRVVCSACKGRDD